MNPKPRTIPFTFSININNNNNKNNNIYNRQQYQLLLLLLISGTLVPAPAQSIRFPGRIPEPTTRPDTPLKSAVFALGCFWRSEAVFGCLNGVVRTTVGYSGGSKINPEYRSLADHAESVQVEYDPRVISFRQLLEVFWSSHDSRQVFGQGPDVGNQYRSIIFTNSTSESRLATVTKEREQAKSKSSVVTTQILPLEIFYPAEPEHQTREGHDSQFKDHVKPRFNIMAE
ncbi:hypothetical protein RND81_11G232500 [Saponaria officinalis]|uniref:Peptide methionine sulfoxide reductase A5 n=1 Tax=Saponaria officinalis TaxID=3572 RepID=A0AAW1HRI5_SAPOF